MLSRSPRCERVPANNLGVRAMRCHSPSHASGPILSSTIRMTHQPDLFASTPADDRKYPQGFRYQTELIDQEQERALVDRIATLPLQEFQFHGYTGKRRVVSFGWKYDYDNRVIRKVDDIPDFLHALRESAAAFAGLDAGSLQQ